MSETLSPSPALFNQWNETEAPKDGRPLVLCGGIMQHDLCTVSKAPFVALAYWSDEHKDWLRWQDGMSLRRAEDDEVCIHFWMPYPQANPGDRPAHEVNYYDGGIDE